MKVLALIVLLAVGYSDASQTCTKSLDLVLAVENPGYFTLIDETRIKNFLVQLVNEFNVDNGLARVALQLYRDTNSAPFNLADFSTTNDVKEAILSTTFANTNATQLTVISDALDYTWNTMLRVDNGERSCNPTVVVLVSFSSYPDPNARYKFRYQAPLPLNQQIDKDIYSALKLRHAGAKLITIGVGPRRDAPLLTELIQYGSVNTGYYFDYREFEDLEDVARAVDISTNYICNAPGASNYFLPIEVETVALDVVFVVDASDALSTFQDAIYNFINNFLTPFSYGQKGVQAALVVYNTGADPAVLLRGKTKPVTSQTDFLNRFKSTISSTSPTSNRDITSALDSVYNTILIDSNGYRSSPDVKKQVYIFSAGCFTSQNDPVQYANQIRSNKNADIFVVNLQKPSNGHKFWKALIDIAQFPNNVFEVQDSPTEILTNYLHRQAWRSLGNGNYVPPYAPTTTSTTAAATTTTTTTDAPTTTTTAATTT